MKLEIVRSKAVERVGNSLGSTSYEFTELNNKCGVLPKGQKRGGVIVEWLEKWLATARINGRIG